jgi:hypothetical protein
MVSSWTNKKLVLTRVWQKWRFSAPQKHLWLIEHWFSASTFVVKIATFAKPESVTRQSHFVFPNGFLLFALQKTK